MRAIGVLSIITVAMLVASVSIVAGDIVEVLHDKARFSSTDKLFCRFCHGGLLDEKIYVEVEFPLAEYRCITCHYGVNSFMVGLVRNSPHRDTGCLGCHIVYHSGHEKYNTRDQGFYGCTGHRIATHDLNPPPGASVYFVDTWISNDTNIWPSSYLHKRMFFSNSPLPQKRITAEAYMNPYTGSFSDIPSDKRYWICFECHFTVKTSASSWPTLTTNYFGAHTDRCAACHSNYYGNATYEPHGIPKASAGDSSKWWYENCGRCHTGVYEGISRSVHSSIGCRCHTQLHISRYNETGSWAFLYKPVVTGPVESPTTLETVRLFYSEAVNSTDYGAPVHPVGYNAGYSYFSQFYAGLEGNATYITETSKYLICLNCHFITKDPLSASMGPVNGKIPIYIPSGNLNIDPHTITGEEFQVETARPAGGTSLPAAFIMISLAIAAILFILVYRALRRA